MADYFYNLVMLCGPLKKISNGTGNYKDVAVKFEYLNFPLTLLNLTL